MASGINFRAEFARASLSCLQCIQCKHCMSVLSPKSVLLIFSTQLQAKELEVPTGGDRAGRPTKETGKVNVIRTPSLLQGADLASTTEVSLATKELRADWAPKNAELSGGAHFFERSHKLLQKLTL